MKLAHKSSRWPTGLILLLVLLGLIVVAFVFAIVSYRGIQHALDTRGQSLSGDPATTPPRHAPEQLAPNSHDIGQSEEVPPMIPNYTFPDAQNGMAPVIYRIPTNLPVVYLGIDDGANKTQEEVDLLAQYHIKASLFLSDLFISSNPDFFKQIVAQGSIVEDHTLSHHTQMIHESYVFQKQEICGMADKIQHYYGRRPTLFRPPGGAYSDSMRKAAHECGMKAVITWIAKANGGSMQYQVGNKLQPGDIVLMHFRPEFAKDLQAFVDAEKVAGLHTELLEDIPGAM